MDATDYANVRSLLHQPVQVTRVNTCMEKPLERCMFIMIEMRNMHSHVIHAQTRHENYWTRLICRRTWISYMIYVVFVPATVTCYMLLYM